MVRSSRVVREKKVALFVVYSPQFRVVRVIFSIKTDGQATTAVFQRAKEEFRKHAQKGDELRFAGLRGEEYGCTVIGKDDLLLSIPPITQKIKVK